MTFSFRNSVSSKEAERAAKGMSEGLISGTLWVSLAGGYDDGAGDFFCSYVCSVGSGAARLRSATGELEVMIV